MRRNNVQQNPNNNLNSLNNNRGKSNNPINNNVNNNFNNNANSNSNKNANLNRNQSSNKFGNNIANSNQRNNTAATNKNFNNIKGNIRGGLPDSAVISDKNYAVFQNQDYFNLDNFNYYGNPNQNNSNNRNMDYNSNDFNKNRVNNNNQRANQINYDNNNNNNFPDPVGINTKKPNTIITVKSQIHFDDYSNKNNNNIARGKKHFSNNQIPLENINLNKGSNNENNDSNNKNNNYNIINKNNNQNNLNNNNNRDFNQNSNNQTQNKSYNKTILLKIKAAKTNGIINISNMNLNSLPKEIFDDTVRFEDINWWELVDIKKIDASNNLIDETFNNENISFEAIPNLNYLKFSGNNFSAIPDSIYSLYSLKFLDFSDNKLRNLSDNIRGLKSLVDLNLSHNSISTIPNEIGKLSELEIMNVSQNKINVISPGIGNIMKLKRLDLSNNFLDCIPICLGALYNLEELILFKNKIRQIQSNSLSKLCNLKYLDLHNNNIDVLTEIPKSDKLDTLILGYNKIEAIDNLKNCPNLTVLDLNNNKLENFPEDVLILKNIITLNLMNNSINDIPPALCYLNKLVRLNIEGNPLRKINSKIRSSNAEQIKSYLKTRIVGNEENDFSVPQQTNNRNNNLDENNEINLQNENNQNNYSNQRENNHNLMPSKESNINLLNYYQNNYLKILNMDIERIPIENFNKFKIFNCVGLDLSNNKLKELSFFEQLPVFHDIQEFKINFNKLTNVNPSIINFKNLRILEMKNNLLTEFFDNLNLQVFEKNNINDYIAKADPKPINNINAIKKNSNNFYDRNNTNNLLNIEDHPKEQETNQPFPNLEYLDLTNNKLRNFPIILKFCTKLNTILLSNNSLTNVDYLSEIKNPSLFTLEMGTNKITALPEKLYQNLPNIKHLGLENNDVKNVPTDLCFMKNLNKVTLSGNPIKLLRANIISGGTKTILEYLRKMHRFTDEEMLMEGEKSNFLNFNNQAEGKTSNKKVMYKNEQSPMDIKNDFNQAMSPNQKTKGEYNPSSNDNIISNVNNDVKEFGDVEMEIENKNNLSKNRNLSSAQIEETFIPQNNPQPQNNFGSHQDELDDVKRQILIVESEMGEGNMPMFKKTDLRRKLNELIRKRANIMRNMNS